MRTLSKVTDEKTLATVKAHIDAIVDGSVVITVQNGKIIFIDSKSDQAAKAVKVNL